MEFDNTFYATPMKNCVLFECNKDLTSDISYSHTLHEVDRRWTQTVWQKLSFEGEYNRTQDIFQV